MEILIFFKLLVIFRYAYTRITIHIWKQKAIGSNKKRQNSLLQRSRVKTIKMLIVIAFVFLICRLPISLYHILADFKLITHDSTLYILCNWLAMSSVCYNPVIFCWMNRNFRQDRTSVYWMCLRCVCTRSSKLVHYSRRLRYQGRRSAIHL